MKYVLYMNGNRMFDCHSKTFALQEQAALERIMKAEGLNKPVLEIKEIPRHNQELLKKLVEEKNRHSKRCDEIIKEFQK